MEDFCYFEGWVRDNLKIDLASYKSKQMQRRILSKMNSAGASCLKEYAQLIGSDERIRHEFINHITINVTEFFRNRNMFDSFAGEFKKMKARHRKGAALRIWSAACSNGSEPYSVAIMLRDSGFTNYEITATDIDEQMLQKAREGSYREMELKGLTEAQIQSHFTREGSGYRIRSEYQNGLKFKKHDLILDPFPNGFDIILCRNVLIYFNEDVKNRIFQQFYQSLNPEGILFIGATETIYNFSSLGFGKLSTCIYTKN